jgi:hypothetical protein
VKQGLKPRVYLSGRFGNQLFQLALCLHLNKIYDDTFILDGSRLAPRDIKPLMESGLIAVDEIYLNIMQQNFLKGKPIGKLYDYLFKFFLYVSFKWSLWFKISLKFSLRKKVPYVEDVEWRKVTKDFGSFQGFFQDGALVSLCWDELQHRFFSSNLSSQIGIDDEDVLIHVRLRDYILHSDIGVLGEDYYLRALKHFNFKNVYLLTDDFEEFNIRYPNLASLVIKLESKKKPLEAFKLICSSRNLVIANSTFSYWGAVFSIMRDSKAKVVAPSPWRFDARETSPLIDRFILEKR